MTAKIDISPEQLVILQGILKDHLPKGTLAWAFGSRVTWTAKPFSDLDIALEGAEPLPSDVLINLEEAFETSDLPWKVDVIDLNAVSPEFRAIVERQRVPADWRDMNLGDLCSFQAGDAFSKEFQGAQFGHVPFIKVSDMNLAGNEYMISRANNWLSDQEAKNYRLHRAGACVFAKIGEALRANRRRILSRPTIIDNNMMSATGQAGTDDRWLYYLLQTVDFNTVSRGSALPYLAVSDLKKIAVSMPPLHEQENIANSLGILDDKIELNRRMNETLEGMARAVFRDWFVDLGPTRRKAAGLTDPAAILGGLLPDATHATPLAALFPGSFGDNGLPEGWKFERLDLYLELAYGKALTKKNRIEGDYPVYGSGGISGTHNAPLANGPAIIVGRKGTVGSLYWEDRDFFAIDTVFYVVPKTRLSFLFYMLETLGLEHMNTDAAVPGLNRNNVYRLERAFGCEATRNAFADLADQFKAMIRNNEKEIQTLATTRDLLLPKLMSGELRPTGTEGAL